MSVTYSQQVMPRVCKRLRAITNPRFTAQQMIRRKQRKERVELVCCLLERGVGDGVCGVACEAQCERMSHAVNDLVRKRGKEEKECVRKSFRRSTHEWISFNSISAVRGIPITTAAHLLDTMLVLKA